MDEHYLIFSIRSQAWFSANGGYDTELKNAKRFTREEAINICANISFGTLGGLPVPVEMTREILDVR